MEVKLSNFDILTLIFERSTKTTKFKGASQLIYKGGQDPQIWMPAFGIFWVSKW